MLHCERFFSEELRARLGIKSILDVLLQRRLRWFGHVERRDDNSWLQKIHNLGIVGQSSCGRPHTTWEQVINEDMCVKDIHQECVQNFVLSGDLQLHEQSNPCLHGLIMD